MKTVYTLLVAFLISFGTNAQIIDIPDTYLKAKLLEADITNDIARDLSDNPFKIDANDDGEIQESEALQVSRFVMTDVFDFTDPTGLSYFVNLKYLDLSDCQQLNDIDVSPFLALEHLNVFKTWLTTLDVSNNTNLTYLNCGHNNLTNLDVSNNTNLTELTCETNNLTTIDVSNNTDLIIFYCDLNELTSLDLSNSLDLELLVCRSNNLTALDLSNNTNLTYLSCFYNNITSLDVSNCLSLETFACYGNEISSIDISNNKLLNYFTCGFDSFLNSIYMKNGQFFDTSNFTIGNSPNLQFICADDEEMNALVNQLNSNGMTVNVNSYCSFTPGGDFNTITGNITFDGQNDGCGSNDVAFPFIKAIIDDGVDTGYTFTTETGEYMFYTSSGTFTVSPEIENAAFFNITPIDVGINFPEPNNIIETQDFCISANGIHPDIEIVIAPSIPARPGFDAEYLITYRNKGNQTVSGDVIFTYDDTVLDYISSTEIPTSQATGILNWDYANLLPFESRSIYVTLNVNSPMEIPAVNIDDELDFTATVNPIDGDDFPSDNTFSYKQIVIGSYDPNDIVCVEGDVVEPSEIGEYLHYIVRFENTGNAPAENVVIETEVDPNQYDINSLRLLSSSHNVDVRVSNNIIKFIFEAIYLEASGGHGNILLRMRTEPSLEINDTVTKDAKIFFDYNFPIETNDANTTFVTLSNPDYVFDSSVSLHPNPVENVLTIKANNIIQSVSLFDIQGRLLQTQTNSNSEIEIDISSRSKGVYFVKILTDKGIKVEKVIKK